MYYNNPMSDRLDRYITGNYSEDQFPIKKKWLSKKKKKRDIDDDKVECADYLSNEESEE